MLLPEVMANHRDEVSARLVFFLWQETASQHRLHSQEGEVVSRNCLCHYCLPPVGESKFGRQSSHADDTVEGTIVFADCFVIGSGLVELPWFPGGICRADLPNFLRPKDRPRSQELVVQQCEQRQIRPDAQRQREHGRGGEAGVLQQHAASVTEILNETLHSHSASGVWVVVARAVFSVNSIRPSKMCSRRFPNHALNSEWVT